jgi:hypothetical protein
MKKQLGTILVIGCVILLVGVVWFCVHRLSRLDTLVSDVSSQTGAVDTKFTTDEVPEGVVPPYREKVVARIKTNWEDARTLYNLSDFLYAPEILLRPGESEAQDE